MASALRRGFSSIRCLFQRTLYIAPLRENSVTESQHLGCLPHICSAFAIRDQHFRDLHTTPAVHDLHEFLDYKDNWGEPAVKVGRPWKKDELRLKNNTDLHKLWYVFLKERNMLMTMEAEYKRQAELFPNPERFEKIEESMENLLEVVAERNQAYNLLETGDAGEPGKRWTYNILGLGYWREKREYHKPKETMKYYYNFTRAWQYKYLRLYREKRLRRERYQAHKEAKHKEKMREIFPDADLD